ncbi:MAG: hypothetical protein GC162_14505 [Planctomycetes bacterium]|nr:hypothetical protein [Planctomycetota bacterium]
MRRILLLIALAVFVPAARGADGDYDFEPINYATSTPEDPVAQLQRDIDAGKIHLAYDPKRGYLPALLDALHISPTSQLLVFSKTSFQIRHISPATPRALYFNDDVYIGSVQHGDVIEISAVDPKLGGVFYTLDVHKSDRPAFVRQTDLCLQCHDSAMTQSVPGHMVRSVTTDNDGFPLLRAGTTVTTHRTPLSNRFGGWYITGTSGKQQHMGNVTLNRPDDGNGDLPPLDTTKGTNVTDLTNRFDTSPYLTPSSDIVAMMVLEHQTHMHNLIARGSYQTRIALYHQRESNRIMSRPENEISPSTQNRIERQGDAILRYMLFIDEPVLENPIAGTTKFREQFEAAGPRDRKGRSLRELNLKHYMFEYPCSYLIYTPAYDAMPPELLDYVNRRLYEILTGRDTSADFTDISTAKRRAVLEILRDTKPTLPPYFQKD